MSALIPPCSTHVRETTECVLCGAWVQARSNGTATKPLRNQIAGHLARLHGSDFGARQRSLLADAMARRARRVAP